MMRILNKWWLYVLTGEKWVQDQSTDIESLTVQGQGYNVRRLQAGMTSGALWSSSQSLLPPSPQGWRLWFLWVEHVFWLKLLPVLSQHVTSGWKKWSKILCNLDNILDSLVLLSFSPNFRREQLQLKSVTYFAASILWSTSSREELWATWKVPKRVFLFFFIFSACEDQTFIVPCFTIIDITWWGYFNFDCNSVYQTYIISKLQWFSWSRILKALKWTLKQQLLHSPSTFFFDMLTPSLATRSCRSAFCFLML